MVGVLHVTGLLNITIFLSNSWESISQWFCSSEEHVDPHTHAGPETYDSLCVVWELSNKLLVQEPVLGKLKTKQKNTKTYNLFILYHWENFMSLLI